MCNEIALVDLPPVAIAAYRVIGAALLLLALCYWRRESMAIAPNMLGLLLIISLLNSVVPFTLIGWGQLYIDSATTGILLATSPFVTLLLSHFMTRDDRFAWYRLFALIMGFIGVCLLLGQGLMIGQGSFAGMLLVVLAACCYSLSSLLIRRLKGMSSVVIATGSLVVGALILLPVLLWMAPPWQQSVRGSSIGALLFLMAGPTALGYVLRAQIVTINGAVFMSNVGYLIPLFAVLWGWLLLGDQPTGIMLAALGLILIGVAMGQNRFGQVLQQYSK